MGEPQRMCFSAMLAQNLGRWDDSIRLIKKMAKLNPNFDYEARVLLSRAYHQQTSERRSLLELLSQSSECAETPELVDAISKMIQQVKLELFEYCEDIIELTETQLFPCACNKECTLFYYKVFADYYRYIAEYAEGDAKLEAIKHSQCAYQSACDIAADNLQIDHPMYMGLILNYSLFLVEVVQDVEEGYTMAYDTLMLAKELTESQSKEWSNDTKMYMRLLEDNIEQWKSDLFVDK